MFFMILDPNPGISFNNFLDKSQASFAEPAASISFMKLISPILGVARSAMEYRISS